MTKRDAFPIGQKNYATNGNSSTLPFTHLDAVKGIRLKSAKMGFYILIINDLSDFIGVNHYQVVRNYILPACKMDSIEVLQIDAFQCLFTG